MNVYQYVKNHSEKLETYLVQPENIFIDVRLFSFRFRYSRCNKVQSPDVTPISKLEMLL